MDKPIKVHALLVRRQDSDYPGVDRGHLPPVEIHEYFARLNQANKYKEDLKADIEMSYIYKIVTLTVSNRG